MIIFEDFNNTKLWGGWVEGAKMKIKGEAEVEI